MQSASGCCCVGQSCVRDIGDGARYLGRILGRGGLVGALVMRKPGRDDGDGSWSHRRHAGVGEGALVVEFPRNIVGGPHGKGGIVRRVVVTAPLVVSTSLMASVSSDVWRCVPASRAGSLTQIGGELGWLVVLTTGRSKAAVDNDGPGSVRDAAHRDRESRPLGGNVEPLLGSLSGRISVAHRRVMRPMAEPRLVVSSDGGGSRGRCTLCRKGEKPAALPLACSGVAWGHNRVLATGISRSGRTSCRTGVLSRGGDRHVPRLFKSKYSSLIRNRKKN